MSELWIPAVEVESAHGIREVSLRTRHLMDRRIFLTGHRYILKHSKVMIHEPLISNGVGGSATSIKNISESILETRDILNGILARQCHRTLEEINKATQFDNFMNAEEAIEFGICDKIADSIRVA